MSATMLVVLVAVGILLLAAIIMYKKNPKFAKAVNSGKEKTTGFFNRLSQEKGQEPIATEVIQSPVVITGPPKGATVITPVPVV